MPKLKPLGEFSLNWTADDYDHEKATKYIHSLLGQIENRETELAERDDTVKTLQAKVKSVEGERDSYRDQANQAEKDDSKEVARLKAELTEKQKQLDTFDVKEHPDYVRLRVQAETGLEASDMARIVGASYDEMLKDANEFKERYGVGEPKEQERLNPGGRPDPDGTYRTKGGADEDAGANYATEKELEDFRSQSSPFFL